MLTKIAVAALAGTLGMTALAGTASADEGFRHPPCAPNGTVGPGAQLERDRFEHGRFERERLARMELARQHELERERAAAQWRQRQEREQLERVRAERRLAWERAHHAYYNGRPTPPTYYR